MPSEYPIPHHPSAIPVPAASSTSTSTPHAPPAPPPGIAFITRILPTGPCSASCACKTYWPAAFNTPVICACGHHACYHSQTPPTTCSHSFPSNLEPAISDRLSAIERTLNLIRRSPATSIQARLAALEMAIADLPERMEVAEERLEQLETHSVELENQIDLIENALDVDEDGEEELQSMGQRTPLNTPPPVYREIPSPIPGRTLPPAQREAPVMIIPAKRRGSSGIEGVEKIEVQVGFKRGRKH